MPTNTFVPIATNLLSADTTTVVFSSIPQTYTDLKLVINGIGSGTGQDYYVRFNSDSSSSYGRAWYVGASGTEYKNAATSASAQLQLMFQVNGSVSGEPIFGEIDIFDYASSSINKSILVNSGSTRDEVGILASRWYSNSAITSITIAGSSSFSLSDLLIGSRFTLYGILAGS